MLDTTPQPHTVGFPYDSTPPPAYTMFHSDAQVPALFRVRVSPSVPQKLYTIHRHFPRAGAFGASQVLRRLSSCMPRPEDSGGPPPPRLVGGFVWPSGALKPSASAIALSKLYQHFRVRGHPCGLQDTLSTLRPSCSPLVLSRLRHGRKTRYGWVANPYPTGTFTLPETPSLSWRDNAAPQPRPKAAAQRTL